MNLLPEVAKMVNRPFPEKLQETRMLIAHNIAIYKNKIAVAFSGGKDSEVVLRETINLQPDTIVVFNDTGVEYRETIKFVERLRIEWHLNLVVTKPTKTFWKCVEEYGMPKPKSGQKSGAGAHGGHCCLYCKEKPMHNIIKDLGILASFTGVTAVENRNRQFVAKKFGMCYPVKHEHIQRVNPILWWTDTEVWQYLNSLNLPHNPIYDKGADRCGCAPCTAFKSWESQLKMTNPKLYAIVKLKKDNQYVMGGINASN